MVNYFCGRHVNPEITLSQLTLSLMPVLSGDPNLQTVRTQIGIDKISGQILIQIV